MSGTHWVVFPDPVSPERTMNCESPLNMSRNSLICWWTGSFLRTSKMSWYFFECGRRLNGLTSPACEYRGGKCESLSTARS